MDESLQELSARDLHIQFIINICNTYKAHCYDLLKTDPMYDLNAASDDLIEAIYDTFKLRVIHDGCIMSELALSKCQSILKIWENDKIFLKFLCITCFTDNASQHIKDRKYTLHYLIFTEIDKETGEVIWYDEYKSSNLDACVDFPECVTTYLQIVPPETDKAKHLSRSWLLSNVLIAQTGDQPAVKRSPKVLNCADVLCDFVYRSPSNKAGWYGEFEYYIDLYCSSQHHERLIMCLATAPERAPFLKALRIEFLFRDPQDQHIAMFIADRRTNTTIRCGICLCTRPGFLHDCRQQSHAVCFHCYTQCSDCCPHCRFNLKTVKTQIDEIIYHNPPTMRFGEYRRMTRTELLQMQASSTSSIAHIIMPVGGVYN